MSWNPFRTFITIRQASPHENLVACLFTWLKQMKMDVPVNQIHELNDNIQEENVLLKLQEMTSRLGLCLKLMEFEQKEITRAWQMPVLVQLADGYGGQYFAVLQKADSRHAWVSDPVKGFLRMEMISFLRAWTGIAGVISNIGRDRELKNVPFLWRFVLIILPYKKIYITVLVASLLFTIFGIIASFYMQFLLDEILQYYLVKTLHVISVGVILLTIFRFCLMLFRETLLISLMQRFDITIIFSYFARLMEMPLQLFQKYKQGELTARYGDAYHIREVMASVIVYILVDALMAVTSGLVLFMQNRSLFGITIIVVIGFGLLGLIFSFIYTLLNEEVMETNAQVNAVLIESIQGVQTIKALNAEKEVCQLAETRLIRNSKIHQKLGSAGVVQTAISFLLYTAGGTVILWVGSMAIMQQKMTVGQLMTFTALLAFFMEPLKNILSSQTKIQAAMVAARRLWEVYDHEVEKTSREAVKLKPASFQGLIELKDLCFRYNENDRMILNKISMTIQPGEKIALVGESGSGKTTLAKLLMYFYEPTSGSIRLDGIYINDIQIDRLRERIAYVPQETFLFNGTITHNLTLGLNTWQMDDVVHAAQSARADEFIHQLPLRYNTVLTENGSNLSGGQRQRLAIARALLRKPDILILDEATSNLDSITEKAIEKTIFEFTRNITSVIIAHRLSTIRMCDRVFVMEKGEIVETGSHDELMKQKGRYWQLWKEQLPDRKEG